MKQIIIAIDPGKNGGIAWSDADGNVQSTRMPHTEGDVVELLSSLTAFAPDRRCYIEKVGGYIAGKAAPGSAMFKFGRGYGVLMGALLALGWRVIEVPPATWQKWLGIGVCKGDKNKLKAEAQRRFPTQKVTLCTADALLIYDYAESKEKKK